MTNMTASLVNERSQTLICIFDRYSNTDLFEAQKQLWRTLGHMISGITFGMFNKLIHFVCWD